MNAQPQFEGRVVQNFEIETWEKVYETVAIGPSPNAWVGGYGLKNSIRQEVGSGDSLDGFRSF